MYGLKTPDNRGLFKIINAEFPKDLSPDTVWPVSEVIPDGYNRVGWELKNGIVEPILAVKEPESKYVPFVVNAFQIRAAIITLDYARDETAMDLVIETYINLSLIDSTQKALEKLNWKRNTEFKRNSNIVETIRKAFNKTSDEIDSLFLEAEKF